MYKIEIENLKKYANLLMFDMNEEEYETLQKEFEVILQQLELIGKIENINSVEPMTFPFEVNKDFREDVVKEELSIEDALKNAKEIIDREIKVPKVVE